jgi:hypothetical protein
MFYSRKTMSLHVGLWERLLCCKFSVMALDSFETCLGVSVGISSLAVAVVMTIMVMMTNLSLYLTVPMKFHVYVMSINPEEATGFGG